MSGRLAARAALYAITIAIAVVALRSFAANSAGEVFSDFRAFYCAGSVAAAGQDPYLQGPLYRCEARAAAPVLWRAENNVANPAPLPPYALALFIPFGKLPYGAAAWVWAIILGASYAATIVALRRLTSLPWAALCLAVLPASLLSVSLGQIAPVAIALMCVSAVLLKRDRPVLAGVAAGLALIEPHLAIPSCIALFLVAKGARVGLTCTGMIFIACSLMLGAPRTVEYFANVLPAHAVSDIQDVGQYSATLVAHLFGATGALALRIGALSYAVMAMTGVAVAVALVKRERELFYAALVPMAFSVIAGSYIHWNQVVAAIPAALSLAAKTPRVQPLLLASLILLPIPWLYVTAWGFLIPAAAMLAGALSWYFGGRRIVPAAAWAAGSLCLLWLANHSLSGGGNAAPFHAVTLPGQLADASWGSYVQARIAISNGPFLWAHLPTWAALLCFAAAVLHEYSGKAAPALPAASVPL